MAGVSTKSIFLLGDFNVTMADVSTKCIFLLGNFNVIMAGVSTKVLTVSFYSDMSMSLWCILITQFVLIIIP